MLDCPKPIRSISHVIWRGRGIVDAEHRKLRIVNVRPGQFRIADRVRCHTHEVKQIRGAGLGAARKGNDPSGWLRAVALVRPARVGPEDVRVESFAASGACSAPDRDLALLTWL